MILGLGVGSVKRVNELYNGHTDKNGHIQRMAAPSGCTDSQAKTDIENRHVL